MLVLSRKVGEKIFVGDNVVVEVVAIDRGKVRLGVTAPRDVPVYRHELAIANMAKCDRCGWTITNSTQQGQATDEAVLCARCVRDLEAGVK